VPARNKKEERTDSAREQRAIGSVANALRLLEALAVMPEAGISELAATLDLSKPAVDRLLVTLLLAGFAEQNPDNRKYRLTQKLVALANGIQSGLPLRELARPHLVGLAQRTRETVNLGVFVRGSIVYLDKIASDDLFSIEVKPGTTLPAYCTALGKAMLAFMPASRVEAYLQSINSSTVAYTSETITGRQELVDQLRQVRERGYANDLGEMLEDVRCVAAPVIDTRGEPIAAVSITVPRSRFDRRHGELAELVLETARQISESAPSAENVTVLTIPESDHPHSQ
jgi:DNA-binding IclR family transcriptional regulator